MATFTYKALDGRGATASGQVDGDNKAAVAAGLRNRGLTIVDINEVKTGLAQTDIFAAMQRVKAKDLTVFSRQFATMINSGLAMLRALDGARRADREQEVRRGARPGAGRRRGRHLAVRRAREAPQGVLAALRQHGPGRRDRRYPRRGPQPPGHPARKRRPDQARGQIGDGLPAHDRELRAHRHDRHGAVPDPRVRRHVRQSSATPSCPCSRASW